MSEHQPASKPTCADSIGAETSRRLRGGYGDGIGPETASTGPPRLFPILRRTARHCRKSGGGLHLSGVGPIDIPKCQTSTISISLKRIPHPIVQVMAISVSLKSIPHRVTPVESGAPNPASGRSTTARVGAGHFAARASGPNAPIQSPQQSDRHPCHSSMTWGYSTRPGTNPEPVRSTTARVGAIGVLRGKSVGPAQSPRHYYRARLVRHRVRGTLIGPD